MAMQQGMGIQQKPVGIFWDIENCSVPKNKSAFDLIAYVRNYFVLNRLNHREFEFVIACDVSRLRKGLTEDVNRAGGVTISHVNGSAKNAADEKLREAMKKFIDTHTHNQMMGTVSPTLVLISGDIDFVNDLRGYQTRLGASIILIHASNASEQFRVGWNEIYDFQTFTAAVRVNPALEAQNNAKNNNAGDKVKNQPKQQGQPNQGGGKKGGALGGGGGPPGQSNGGPRPRNKNPSGGGPDGNGSPQGSSGGFYKPQNQPKPRGGPPNGPSNYQQNEAGGTFKNQFQQQPRKQQQQNGAPQNLQGPKPKNHGPPEQQQRRNIDQVITNLDNMRMNGAPQPPKLPKHILMVSGLPGKMDFKILKDHLQEQANSVNGKVKYVKNGQAFIGFKNKDDAIAAVRLFNGKEVYDKKLNVCFTSNIPFENPMDKKLKGGPGQTQGANGFVVVNHSEVPGFNAKSGPQGRKQGGGSPPGPRPNFAFHVNAVGDYGDAPGGFPATAPGANPRNSGGPGFAVAGSASGVGEPPRVNWTQQILADPNLAGQLGTFAGAAFAQYTSVGSSSKSGQKQQNKQKKDESCCIQ